MDVDAKTCRVRAKALVRKADEAPDYTTMIACERLAREWLRLAAILEADTEESDLIDLHVSERLRTFRKEAGLDFKELGDRTGITVREIQLYEGGALPVPAAAIWSLARGLQRSVSAFYPAMSET